MMESQYHFDHGPFPPIIQPTTLPTKHNTGKTLIRPWMMTFFKVKTEMEMLQLPLWKQVFERSLLLQTILVSPPKSLIIENTKKIESENEELPRRSQLQCVPRHIYHLSSPSEPMRFANSKIQTGLTEATKCELA